jgi:hypothetical protein
MAGQATGRPFYFMDEFTETLLEGLASLEESSGATITWRDNDYPVAGGPELGGKLLGQGGYRVTAQVTIVVRVALFGSGARPVEKSEILYTSAEGADGRPLKIQSVNIFRNAFLVLECNDPNQGA